VVVQCPEPKSTKLTKGFVSTFNAPGNDGSGVYRRVDIYDINGGWVQYVYNSYYYNANLVSCVNGVLGSMYQTTKGPTEHSLVAVKMGDRWQRSGLVQSGMTPSLHENASGLMLASPSAPRGAFFSSPKAHA
jgi:hypothetical protein